MRTRREHISSNIHLIHQQITITITITTTTYYITQLNCVEPKRTDSPLLFPSGNPYPFFGNGILGTANAGKE